MTLRRRARQLFAIVLDRPGGLGIATIHGFCQSLLGRFPLEAGLAPNFQLLDERTASELLGEAIRGSLAAALDDEALSADLAIVTGHAGQDAFTDLVKTLATERGRLERAHDQLGLPGLAAEIHRALDTQAGVLPQDLRAAACEDAAFDGPGLREAVAVLRRGSPNQDARTAERLEGWLAGDLEKRLALLETYRSAFFTEAGDIRADRSLMTGQAGAVGPPGAGGAEGRSAPTWRLLGARVAAATVAQATMALVRITLTVLERYAGEKRRRGAVDFEDLILGTRALLEEPGTAPWVLFKLDGGIDHILIDEAQDTNPDQWRVVASLAGEFFAGLGSNPAERTIFAVGDPKQSIYSFQRADPAEFRRMRAHFAQRVEEADRLFHPVELATSFRSTRAVLALTDAVFAAPEAGDGVVPPGIQLSHGVQRQDDHGLVELWPPIDPEPNDEPEAWALPHPGRAAVAPEVRLAELIAKTIRGWLDEGTWLSSARRPIRAGDVMILLRQRGRLLQPLVEALKAEQVPVAGADRMVLTEQLAVMDLMALGRFLLLPEDDLTLAVVLKGPLYGISEEALFGLAYGRRKASLWSRLRDAGSGGPSAALHPMDTGIVERAVAELSDLLARADFVAPYELYADLMGRRGGRRRFLARLGLESAEAMDEFMAAALRFEREHPPSLQGFLGWLDAGHRGAEARSRGRTRRGSGHHGAWGQGARGADRLPAGHDAIAPENASHLLGRSRSPAVLGSGRGAGRARLRRRA